MAEMIDEYRCPISDAFGDQEPFSHCECWFAGDECCGCNGVRDKSTVEPREGDQWPR